MVMRQVEDLAAHIPETAFAVDGDLRVVALGPKALRNLRRNDAEVVGRRCYEVVSAVDTATGLPCRERCPLAAESGRPRWAESRLLSSKVENGSGGRLDCLLLKCLVAGVQPAKVLKAAIGEEAVIARARRHLYRRVMGLRILEFDHFENEEAFVCSIVREHVSERDQLDLARRLLMDEDAEDPRWVIDWVASELAPGEQRLLSEMEARFTRAVA